MKNVKFWSSLLVAGIFFLPAAAQEVSRQQVPSVVVNSFKAKFPQATDVDWERSRTHYEVEFEIGRLDHAIWLNQEGEVIRHQQELKIRSLPEQVRAQVRQQFPGYRIIEADKLQTEKITAYKLELITWTNKTEIIVDEQGQVLEGFIWD